MNGARGWVPPNNGLKLTKPATANAAQASQLNPVLDGQMLEASL